MSRSTLTTDGSRFKVEAIRNGANGGWRLWLHVDDELHELTIGDARCLAMDLVSELCIATGDKVGDGVRW